MRTPVEDGAEDKLRHDLAELLKAHRQQGRLLERSQKVSHDLEAELDGERERALTLEAEIASLRKAAGQHQARIVALETVATAHTSLQAVHSRLVDERRELEARLKEVSRSRENAEAEQDRLAAQLAALHATLAARDAEVASLEVAADERKKRVVALTAELGLATERLADLEKVEAARAHLELEYQALAARWDVAREQLAEAEQALKTSQSTIKAAQRLSSSVEWRPALDSVLDAASELVRFERGTLALVDDLQEELKIEAARNSPIAVSEMSRFKVGEGIAGWAISHREPVLVRDSRSDSRFKASDPKHQPRSFIAVPLLAGADALGVLTLARTANDPFTEHDLRSLARVASDAATALINARLVTVLKQREDDLTTLVQKAKELASAGDTRQVIEFILKSACEFTQGKAALLALRDPRTHELEVAGSLGLPPELLEQRIAWGAPAAADVVRSGKPWVAPMREMLPAAVADAVEKAGLMTMVSVPCGDAGQPGAAEDTILLSRSDLESREPVIGVLNVYRQVLDPVPGGQLEQLTAFAGQASVAIGNVRRWEKVKDQLQTTASLNARLMGRERYIHQLHFRIQQLEQELSRYKAA